MVQPSAGIHIILPGYYSPRSMGLLDPATSDGRVIFFLPWLGKILLQHWLILVHVLYYCGKLGLKFSNIYITHKILYVRYTRESSHNVLMRGVSWVEHLPAGSICPSLVYTASDDFCSLLLTLWFICVQARPWRERQTHR